MSTRTRSHCAFTTVFNQFIDLLFHFESTELILVSYEYYTIKVLALAQTTTTIAD